MTSSPESTGAENKDTFRERLISVHLADEARNAPGLNDIVTPDLDVRQAIAAVAAAKGSLPAGTSIRQRVTEGDLAFRWALVTSRRDTAARAPGRRDGGLGSAEAVKAELDRRFEEFHSEKGLAAECKAIASRDPDAIKRILDGSPRVLKDVAWFVGACADCSGEGYLACKACEGSGLAACEQCRGSTKVRCRYCAGKGCTVCSNTGTSPCLNCGKPRCDVAGKVPCATCAASRKTGRLACTPCEATGATTTIHSIQVSLSIRHIIKAAISESPASPLLPSDIASEDNATAVLNLYRHGRGPFCRFQGQPNLTFALPSAQKWTGILVKDEALVERREPAVLEFPDSTTVTLRSGGLDDLVSMEFARVRAATDPFEASDSTPLGKAVASDARAILGSATVSSTADGSVCLFSDPKKVPFNLDAMNRMIEALTSPDLWARWRQELVAWASHPDRCARFVPDYVAYLERQRRAVENAARRAAEAKRAQEEAEAAVRRTRSHERMKVVLVIAGLVLALAFAAHLSGLF